MSDCCFRDSAGRCTHEPGFGSACNISRDEDCPWYSAMVSATEDDVLSKCEDDKHEFHFSRYCGADVCDVCGYHKGLARCFCGWSETGGDGYRELLEDGEQIEDDY